MCFASGFSNGYVLAHPLFNAAAFLAARLLYAVISKVWLLSTEPHTQGTVSDGMDWVSRKTIRVPQVVIGLQFRTLL